MTVKTFKTYKYTPFTYNIHKPHYWYVDRTVTPTADYSETINLEKFSLPDDRWSMEDNIISFKQFQLWDYTSFTPDQTNYVLSTSKWNLVQEPSNVWSMYKGCLGPDSGLEWPSYGTYTVFTPESGEGTPLIYKQTEEDKEGYKWAGHFDMDYHDNRQFYGVGYEPVGSLVYDENFNASGFNLNNYIVIPAEAFQIAGDEWEISIKTHFNRRGNYYHMLLHTVADNKDLCFVNNLMPSLWGTRAVGVGQLETEGDYIFVIRRIGGKYLLYVSGEDFEAGPTSWYNLKDRFLNFAVLTADHDFSQGVMLGAGTASNRYWSDSINIKEVWVAKIDGDAKTFQTVYDWHGTYTDGSKSSSTWPVKMDNYLTDQWQTGSYGLYYDKNWALVGFSNSTDKVIQTNYQYSFTNGDTNVWQCHFRTPATTPTTRGDLMYANTRDTLGSCLYLIANTQTPEFKMPKANLTLTSNESLKDDTEYYVRVTLQSSQFFAGSAKMELSTNGTSWRTVAYQGNEQLEVDWPATGPVNYSDETNTTNLYLGLSTYTTGNYFRGGIYPDGTFITVNGVKRWAMTK